MLLSAAGVFLGTNLDDLVLLTALWAGVRGRHIWLGQYLGFLVLVAISLLAATGLRLLPDHLVGLLGFVPIGLGLVGLLRARRQGTDEPPVAYGPLSVAGLTIASGADNVGVYTPLFRTSSPAEIVLTVAVFLVLLALWLLASALLGRHPLVVSALDRVGHWLVPAVFVAIGVVIVLRSDLF